MEQLKSFWILATYCSEIKQFLFPWKCFVLCALLFLGDQCVMQLLKGNTSASAVQELLTFFMSVLFVIESDIYPQQCRWIKITFLSPTAAQVKCRRALPLKFLPLEYYFRFSWGFRGRRSKHSFAVSSEQHKVRQPGLQVCHSSSWAQWEDLPMLTCLSSPGIQDADSKTKPAVNRGSFSIVCLWNTWHWRVLRLQCKCNKISIEADEEHSKLSCHN